MGFLCRVRVVCDCVNLSVYVYEWWLAHYIHRPFECCAVRFDFGGVVGNKCDHKQACCRNQNSFLSVVGAQFLALLFNFGDCGDATGGYNFFEILLGSSGRDLCGGDSNLSSVLFCITIIAYITVLIVALIKSYRADPVPEIRQ